MQLLLFCLPCVCILIVGFLLVQVFSFSEAKEEGKEKDEVVFESPDLKLAVESQPKKKL